jgi:hypothetical protein
MGELTSERRTYEDSGGQPEREHRVDSILIFSTRGRSRLIIYYFGAQSAYYDSVLESTDLH